MRQGDFCFFKKALDEVNAGGLHLHFDSPELGMQ